MRQDTTEECHCIMCTLRASDAVLYALLLTVHHFDICAVDIARLRLIADIIEPAQHAVFTNIPSAASKRANTRMSDRRTPLFCEGMLLCSGSS